MQARTISCKTNGQYFDFSWSRYVKHRAGSAFVASKGGSSSSEDYRVIPAIPCFSTTVVQDNSANYFEHLELYDWKFFCGMESEVLSSLVGRDIIAVDDVL